MNKHFFKETSSTYCNSIQDRKDLLLLMKSLGFPICDMLLDDIDCPGDYGDFPIVIVFTDDSFVSDVNLYMRGHSINEIPYDEFVSRVKGRYHIKRHKLT